MSRKWKTFWFGLSVRLAGLGLIVLGDGHNTLFRKSLVVIGVVLTVGGIAVLRYLLLAEPLSRLTKRKPPAVTPPLMKPPVVTGLSQP